MSIRYSFVLLAVCMALLTQRVLSQTQPILIVSVIGGPVSPSNPQAKVAVSVAFTPVTTSTAVAQATFSLGSDDTLGAFSALNYGAGLTGYCPGGPVGTPSTSGGVSGVSIYQLNVLGCQANPANPIEIWTSTWATSNFEPRSVQLKTELSSVSLYSDHGQSGPNIFFSIGEVVNGSAIIQVIPAPGALALLFTSTALTRRRRR